MNELKKPSIEILKGIHERYIVEVDKPLTGSLGMAIKIYCYANTGLKTWFISLNKHNSFPIGSKLIFEGFAMNTKEDARSYGMYPKVEDVVIISDGRKLKIIKIKQ